MRRHGIPKGAEEYALSGIRIEFQVSSLAAFRGSTLPGPHPAAAAFRPAQKAQEKPSRLE